MQSITVIKLRHVELAHGLAHDVGSVGGVGGGGVWPGDGGGGDGGGGGGVSGGGASAVAIGTVALVGPVPAALVALTPMLKVVLGVNGESDPGIVSVTIEPLVATLPPVTVKTSGAPSISTVYEVTAGLAAVKLMVMVVPVVATTLGVPGAPGTVCTAGDGGGGGDVEGGSGGHAKSRRRAHLGERAAAGQPKAFVLTSLPHALGSLPSATQLA